jgi:hypothetical protein
MRFAAFDKLRHQLGDDRLSAAMASQRLGGCDEPVGFIQPSIRQRHFGLFDLKEKHVSTRCWIEYTRF